MKRYEVYRNIRKKALIYGLPITFFAIMMLSVVGSLLVIIFSFSLNMILSVAIANLFLYFLLTRMTANPRLLNIRRNFPQMISNKKCSGFSYEN